MKTLWVLFLPLLVIAAPAPKGEQKMEYAVFAGGCFWCMEPPFEALEGVQAVISGYAGGAKANPTYEEVSAGGSGHLEVIKVEYDPHKISYEKLLEVFWQQIDPTDDGGQFVDRGPQYGTAIFYANEKQKELAEKSKENLEKSKRFEKKIVTPIRKLDAFYSAEEYHQDYYKNHSIRYKYYRLGSGRDKFLDSVWKNKK